MPDSTTLQSLDEETLSILRCPVTGGGLRLEGDFLVSEIGGLRYAVRNGIPVLLAEEVKLPPGFDSLSAFKEQFKNQIRK